MNIRNYLKKSGKGDSIRVAYNFSEKSPEKQFKFSELISSAEFQLVIPIGKFDTGKYGEVMFDQAFCQQVVSNWQKKVLGNRQPFVDVEHDMGEAQGWLVDMRTTDAGLECKFDWTEPGADKINKKLYKYFSAGIAKAKNIDTGEEYYPVLAAVSLTNTPVLNGLPEVQLSEGLYSKEKTSKIKIKLGNAKAKKNYQEQTMSWEDILKAIAGMAKQTPLTDDQKKQICEAAGLEIEEEADAGQGDEAMDDNLGAAGEAKDEQVAPAPAKKTMSAKKGPDGITVASKTTPVSEGEKPPEPALKGKEQNMSTMEKVIALQQKQIEFLMGGVKKLAEKNKSEEREIILEKALSEGKITPSMVEEYRKFYDESPALVSKMLSGMPANALFGELGMEGGAPTEGKQFSEADIQLSMKLNNFTRAKAKEQLEKFS